MPIYAIFPAAPPDPTKLIEAQPARAWADLLDYKTELTRDWDDPAGIAVRPLNDYHDHDELRAIVLDKFRRDLGGVLNPIIEGRKARDPATDRVRLGRDQRRDDFLSRVKTVCRLREDKDAEVKRIASRRPFDEGQIRSFLVNHFGEEDAAKARFAVIDQVKDLLGLSQKPRMLSFIADLEDEDLLAAKEKEGEITSAELFRLILERWLVYEYERQQPKGALPALSVEERWSVATQLALRLWQRTERALTVSEMSGAGRGARRSGGRLVAGGGDPSGRFGDAPGA